jgi:hypothetical protein
VAIEQLPTVSRPVRLPAPRRGHLAGWAWTWVGRDVNFGWSQLRGFIREPAAMIGDCFSAFQGVSRGDPPGGSPGRRGRVATAGRPPGAGPGGRGERRTPCGAFPSVSSRRLRLLSSPRQAGGGRSHTGLASGCGACGGGRATFSRFRR